MSDHGGEGQVRISDAERDHMVEVLRRHLAEGRLDLDTFEDRVGTVVSARSRREADRAFVDLPLLAAASTAKRAGRRRSTERPKPWWRPTDERFRDPASGLLTRVWVDPFDGSRHYLPD